MHIHSNIADKLEKDLQKFVNSCGIFSSILLLLIVLILSNKVVVKQHHILKFCSKSPSLHSLYLYEILNYRMIINLHLLTADAKFAYYFFLYHYVCGQVCFLGKVKTYISTLNY